MKIVEVILKENRRSLSTFFYIVYVESGNVLVKYERSLFGRWVNHRNNEVKDSSELEKTFQEWMKHDAPKIGGLGD